MPYKSRKSMNAPEAHFGDFVDPNRHSVLFRCVSRFGFRHSFRAACSGIIAPVCSIGAPREPQNVSNPKVPTVASVSLLILLAQVACIATHAAEPPPVKGLASWYGEEHRGKLMANGKRFNPDKLTAASWFYPLGTKVRVTLSDGDGPRRSVVVTITDRGPSKELVRDGRIIDLTHAAFRRLAHPNRGLVSINVELPEVQPAKAAAQTAVAAVGPVTMPVSSNLEVCQLAPPATQR